MTVTETTSTSWFTRLKNALIAIVFGIIFVLAAIYFLFTNEGRSIEVYRALVEGAGLVIDVDSAKPDAVNNGKLVHLSGKVVANSTPTDPVFTVSAPGAIAVLRKTEMYQWVESSDSKTENKVGGGTETTTTYSYSKEWKSGREDSSSFRESGHDNPDPLVESARFVVDTAALGGFEATGDQLVDLGDEVALPLKDEDAARIAGTLATDRPVQLNQGSLYVGASASSPQIGDMKITFELVKLTEASMIGKQDNNHIVAYTASNGRDIFRAEAGIHDAASMFKSAQDENTLITWIIRVAGLVGMLVGFSMIFSIFGVIGDVIPFVGSIVRFGTGIIAFALTLVIGPVTIAIGWFAYRPLLATIVIAVGLLIAFGAIYLRRKRVAAAPAATPDTQFGRPA